MLMVAPRGSTKLETSFRAPSCWVASMLKGSVPTLLALEKAKSMGSLMARKNRRGLRPAKPFTARE